MEHPIAYTDGACLGNPGPGGWGIRIYYPDGTVGEFGGAAASTTNNRMELRAAIEALKRLTAFPQATVVTDSRYVIDGLTKWLQAWRRRGWMTVAGTPVKNKRLWMALDRLNHAGIRWQHVRGHAGEPNNERVDTIARARARGERPGLFQGPAGDALDPVSSAPTSLRPAAARSPGQTPVAKARYVSIVRGNVALDDDWAACEARVRGVSGARYKKVRNAQELADFCAKHDVEPPSDICRAF
jgi:ribonuclease HI